MPNGFRLGCTTKNVRNPEIIQALGSGCSDLKDFSCHPNGGEDGILGSLHNPSYTCGNRVVVSFFNFKPTWGNDPI